MSRRVSQSYTLSYAELKFILSIFCETLRFISEPLRENKNNFLVNPGAGGEARFKLVVRTFKIIFINLCKFSF